MGKIINCVKSFLSSLQMIGKREEGLASESDETYELLNEGENQLSEIPLTEVYDPKVGDVFYQILYDDRIVKQYCATHEKPNKQAKRL